MPGETCWAGGMQSPAAARLHVLLSMMNVCIKWDKSAENAVSLHWLVVSDNDHRLLMSLAVVTVGVVKGFVWSCNNALSYFAATFFTVFRFGVFFPRNFQIFLQFLLHVHFPVVLSQTIICTHKQTGILTVVRRSRGCSLFSRRITYQCWICVVRNAKSVARRTMTIVCYCVTTATRHITFTASAHHSCKCL